MPAGTPGSIELICGCMFSGKSERLIARAEAARQEGRRVIGFKHASDDRYDAGHIASHNGRTCPARPVHQAEEIAAQAGDAELVLIDEAQFFGPEIVDVCRRLAADGRSVILAGLDRDSWGEPFGPMPALAAIADQVVRTQGICSQCGRPADHTQRVSPVGGINMVGGPGAYEARCSEHFQAPPAALRR
jgi:thymidine kinase